MHKPTRSLYVLTHTETYDNKNRTFSGWRNSILTPRGHRQAEKMAKRLRNKRIGLAFISPLKRTRQTLNHLLRFHPDTKVVVEPRITERDYGRLTGKNKRKYHRSHPELYVIYHRSYEVPPPGGESMVAVEKRVLRFIRHVRKVIKQKKINAVIVAHNNSIRPIRRYFEHQTPEQMMKDDNRHQIFTYKIKV